jgi:hypothetical protein
MVMYRLINQVAQIPGTAEEAVSPRTGADGWRSGFGILGSLLAGALVACGPRDHAGVQTQFRDSAGVVIAESSGLPEMGAGGWILDQNPSLSIGTLEGDPSYQFHRISGAVKLSDGRIAVSDNGDHELRIYSSDGTFLTRFGREGEGPGEFQEVLVMGTVGLDTLVVLDGSQRRVALFDPDEGFLRQALLPEEAGVILHSNGMFGDGSIVFGGAGTLAAARESPASGYQRLTDPFYSVTVDGEGITHFGDFPGTEVYWTVGVMNGRETRAAGFVLFGKSPRAWARGDRLALGTRDRFEVNLFDPSGDLVRIVRVDVPPVAVTAEHLDGLLQERLAQLPSPDLAPAVRSAFGDTPHAETVPPFETLLLDSEAFLWVEDYHLPGDTLRSWTVFDWEGVPKTRLFLPYANRVFEIGEDYVLALFENDLGVHFLRMYPLARGV